MQIAQLSGFSLYMVVTVVFSQFFVSEARAQNYPNKTVRVVTGSPVGGGGDFTTRMVAQKLPQFLGGPAMVVENRPGASQSLAAALVAKSPADGYTLAFLTVSINAVALMETPPLNLDRDLAPVALAALGPNILVVHPSVPARNVKELLALARAHPGKLNYGSAGVGSSPHLSGELLNYMAKVKTVHVPYKGGATSGIANAAGEVEMSYPGIASAQPLMAAGKLRGIAVTSVKRSSQLPSVPTISESGVPGYDQTNWYGMFVPAAVPKDIIVQLNEGVNRALNTPDSKGILGKQGLEPQTNTPEQFAAYIRNDLAVFVKLAKLIGLKAE